MEQVDHYSEVSQTFEPSIWVKGTKGGAITALVLIVFSVLVFTTGIEALKSANGIANYLSIIIGIILTQKAFKSENRGFMSYGQGLGLGSVLGLIAGAINGAFTYIYFQFVDSTPLELIKDEAIDKLDSQNLTDDQYDQTLMIYDYIFSPAGLSLMGLVGIFLLGFVFSLIISAFTKERDPELEY